MTRLASIGFSLLATAIMVANAKSEARMTISESWFNFGYMPQYSKVSHSFWLKSTGDAELRVVEVIPGCGCTQMPLEKEVIPIGDSARLEIIFDSQRMKNRITKSPRIKTNGSEPEKKLQIIATVVESGDTTRPLFFEPFRIDVLGTAEDAARVVTFKITNLSDQKVELSLLDQAPEFFELKLPASLGPGESQSGTVTLKKNVLDTSFAKSFTIQTDDEWSHRFTVPVARKTAQRPPAAAGNEGKGK